MRHPVSRVMVDPSGNASGSLVLVQFEGLSGQKIIELLNLNGRREEWRIEVVGCQLQILVEHFLKNLVEVSVSSLCVMKDCVGCRVFARS